MIAQVATDIEAEVTDFAANEVAPRAGEIDRTETMPREIVDRMGELGLLGATVPARWGGLELDQIVYGSLTETVGKACASTRALMTVHGSLVATTLAERGSERLRNKYLGELARGELIGCFALSEPGAGSDAAGVQTRYERVGEDFVINGEKRWTSFAGIADLALVLAVGADRALTAFLVELDSAGIELAPIGGMLGNRGTHMASISFSDVRVPAENRVGAIGAGFSFVANTALFHGRYSIAWAGVALAQAALEAMCSYAMQREQFGSRIGAHQLVSALVADAVVGTDAARALCRRAGASRATRSRDAVAHTNIAKYFASTNARRVTADAVQVLGANGCWSEYPTERLYREAKILEIIEGTSQLQQVMIADHAFRTYGRSAHEHRVSGV